MSLFVIGRLAARKVTWLRRIGISSMVLVAFVSAVGCSQQSQSEPCVPHLVDASGDVQASSESMEVWALVFTRERFAPSEPVFVPKDQEIKIVWRSTGEGDVSFQAEGPDGAVVTPIWGPDGPRGSNWNTHPGEEWGTGWVFPESGCWSIELERGDSVAHLNVEIRG